MLARNYAKDIVDMAEDIDHFVSADECFALEDAAAVEYLKKLPPTQNLWVRI